MFSLLTLALPLFVNAAVVSANSDTPTSAAEIDKTYTGCVAAAATDPARAACLSVSLPQMQQSLGAVVNQLLTALNADPESKETSALLQAAHAAYPASRDADCRLRVKVIEGDESSFRECVYGYDKARLTQYEQFLHFAVN